MRDERRVPQSLLSTMVPTRSRVVCAAAVAAIASGASCGPNGAAAMWSRIRTVSTPDCSIRRM